MIGEGEEVLPFGGIEEVFNGGRAVAAAAAFGQFQGRSRLRKLRWLKRKIE